MPSTVAPKSNFGRQICCPPRIPPPSRSVVGLSLHLLLFPDLVWIPGLPLRVTRLSVSTLGYATPKRCMEDVWLWDPQTLRRQFALNGHKGAVTVSVYVESSQGIVTCPTTSIATMLSIASHTTVYILLGVGVCAGTFTILIHALLYKGKTLSRISGRSVSPPSSPVKASKPKSPSADYSKVFPPSQRHVLGEIAPTPLSAGGQPAPIDLSVSPRPILALDEDYRQADPSKYIFSGFTVGEVKALGNFPDYAKLSGLPPPTPLHDFNIDDAQPRPYRPFRWSYHQTMCT